MRIVLSTLGILALLSCLRADLSAAEKIIPSLKARRDAALESIRIEDLRNHVNFLSSDTLEGRAAGSRGGRAASIYLAEQFKKADLAGGATPSSYIQEFSGEMRNVLGLLPGRDPVLKDEYIIVCGHFDHVGYGNSVNSHGPTGYIHNGADDNASGVATILEIMDAFRTLKEAPKRSVLFAFWDGEEIDLLGSKHWVRQPTVPFSRVKFVVNLDMVGRLRSDKVELIGVRTANGMRELLSRHNQTSLLTVDFPWEVPNNSDHHVFFERRIPVLVPFTGFHADYHRPSDDPDKLNFDGMKRIGQWMFSLLLDLAEGEDPIPGFRAQALQEGKAEQASAEYDAGGRDRWGAYWLETGSDQKGAIVTGVTKNSPAYRNGLQEGDRVLTWNGTPVNGQTASDLVRDSTSAAVLEIVRRGEAETRAIKVDLEGVPQRFGMTWREDPVESGTLVVTHIDPDSPAARGGVRIKDRIYGIGNERTRNTSQFLQYRLDSKHPAEILLERDGRFYSVKLP
ncbi:MAG: M20/M25/M40 family metallo-hydrolase [Planctomycetales bacterium]